MTMKKIWDEGLQAKIAEVFTPKVYEDLVTAIAIVQSRANDLSYVKVGSARSYQEEYRNLQDKVTDLNSAFYRIPEEFRQADDLNTANLYQMELLVQLVGTRVRCLQSSIPSEIGQKDCESALLMLNAFKEDLSGLDKAVRQFQSHLGSQYEASAHFDSWQSLG